MLDIFENAIALESIVSDVTLVHDNVTTLSEVVLDLCLVRVLDKAQYIFFEDISVRSG